MSRPHAYTKWTMPELARLRVLVYEVELPAASIAKLLTHEFGKPRSADGIRWARRHHFGWVGKRGGGKALDNARS